MLSPTDRNRDDPVSLHPWPSLTFGSQSAATGCGYYGGRSMHRHTIHGAYDTGARARQHGICCIRKRRLSGCFLFGLIEYPREHHRSFLDKRKSTMLLSAISQSIIFPYSPIHLFVYSISIIFSFLPSVNSYVLFPTKFLPHSLL